MISTGNPNQLWEYDEPSEGGNVHVVKSEQEIVYLFIDNWIKIMLETGKLGIINKAHCIDDWIIVNWASKVNENNSG